MDLTGQSIVANHTKFNTVGGLKVKKTLEGHLIFGDKGFEFKKGIGEILQVLYDDVLINYSDIKEIKPIDYGPFHTIMIVITKDNKEYRFSSYRRGDIIEFLKEKMEG